MRSVQTVDIAAGQSVSNGIDLGLEGKLSGIITDANWTTAGIQVEGSVNGVDYFPVFNDAALLGVTSAAASMMYVFDVKVVEAIRYMRVRSGTSAVPAAQTNATTVIICS